MPEPTFDVLEETIDMRRFIMGSYGEGKCIEQLNDISFQHQFCIKKIDGKTLIWGKKYSTTTEWAPSSGLQFLKFISDHPIFASKIGYGMYDFLIHSINDGKLLASFLLNVTEKRLNI